MIDWLHDLSPVLGAAIVAGCFVVPTVIGSALLQPVVGRLLRGERDANTVVALLVNSFILYYGVLLALLSIAVFENHGKAEEAIGREASSIVALYRDLGGYPEPHRTSLRDLLRRYVDEEAGPGWREQQQGRASAAGTSLVDELSRHLMSFEPAGSVGQNIRHAETLRMFDEFVERRRTRIQSGRTSIPLVIWGIVLTGAVLNVLVMWLFDLNQTTHFILGGVLTGFIGLVIYMLAILDQPFRGAHGLRPGDLLEVRQQMVD